MRAADSGRFAEARNIGRDRPSGPSRLLKKSPRLRDRVIGGGFFHSWLGCAADSLGCGIDPPVSCRRTHLARRGEELWQTDDIVGGYGEDEGGPDLVEAAHFHLREAGDRLAPTEAFLDALAQPLADRIAQARCDFARDGGLAHHAVLAHRSVDRHMRLDPAR